MKKRVRYIIPDAVDSDPKLSDAELAARFKDNPPAVAKAKEAWQRRAEQGWDSQVLDIDVEQQLDRALAEFRRQIDAPRPDYLPAHVTDEMWAFELGFRKGVLLFWDELLAELGNERKNKKGAKATNNLQTSITIRLAELFDEFRGKHPEFASQKEARNHFFRVHLPREATRSAWPEEFKDVVRDLAERSDPALSRRVRRGREYRREK